MMMTIIPALKQPRIVQLNLLVLKVSYSILTTHYSVLTLMTLNSHHTQHALLRSDSKQQQQVGNQDGLCASGLHGRVLNELVEEEEEQFYKL